MQADRKSAREEFWSRIAEAATLAGALFVVMLILTLTACGKNAPVTLAHAHDAAASEGPGVEPALPEAAARAPTTEPEAERFLAQATIGPLTQREIAQVQARGAALWLEEQFALPVRPYRMIASTLPASADSSAERLYETLWEHRRHGPDRLRARVAFALSQLFAPIVAEEALTPELAESYMDSLNRGAFGSYRDLLAAMLRHPVTQGSRHAGADFAQAVLRQFALGEAVDVDTSRSLVEALAQALAAARGEPGRLTRALDAALAHPAAPIFVSRALIERLVTDTPSAAYVARVANVFANNGQGVRGDLRALVRAILLDAEARHPDNARRVAVVVLPS